MADNRKYYYLKLNSQKFRYTLLLDAYEKTKSAQKETPLREEAASIR